MPYIKDWKPSDPLQILIFAKHKQGKSWGAFTFPRPVVFDYDKGIATARNPEFVQKYGVRPIFYEQFEEQKFGKGGVPLGHNAFDESCRFYDEWMKPSGKWKGIPTGRDLFDTWIIDSGTTLSEFAQNKAVILLGAKGLSRTQKEAVETGLVTPRIQDYGAERSMIEQFVDMVKSSGKNVVMICHEKEVWTGEPPDQKMTDIMPLLTGKSSQAIPLKFDEVYCLRNKPKGPNMERYLQTQPDDLRRVGTRYGIPDGTAWDYESLRTEVERIHALQANQITGSL